MKKYYSYVIIGVSFVLIVFTVAFYYSYTRNVILNKTSNKDSNIEDTEKNVNKDLLVSNNQSNKITQKTVYEVITQNRDSNTESTSVEIIPTQLIGKDKDGVIEYVNDYMNNPGLEEINKGLILCELVGFSSEKLVVRKVYDTNISKNKFFIVEEGGYITVYYQDKQAVFEYTHISVNYLNKEEIDKLKEGFYVENEEKLYSILEGYSS